MEPGRGEAGSGVLRVASCKIHVRSNRIERDGREVHVEPRVMKVLLCLVERAGQPVTRGELKARAWPDCFVGEDALNSCISKLRRALGDDRNNRIIQTIPKVGYTLMAPVCDAEVKVSSPDPGRAPADRTTRTRRWIWISALLGAAAATGVGLLWLRVPERGQAGRDVPRFTRLTSFPGLEVDPTISPDGSRIAFSWDGREQQNWDLYVVDIGGAPPQRLTSHPGCDHHPAWSPDGSQVAFARFHDQGPCDIEIVPAGGGLERRVGTCEGQVIFDLDWAPDGRRLILSDGPGSGTPYRLIELDLDSGTRRVLTAPPEGSMGDLSAEYSPDGRRIAFLRRIAGGAADLWMMEARGGEARAITSDEASIQGFAWSAVDDALVFASTREGSLGLWRVSTSGGTVERMGDLNGELRAPAVSSDGRLLAMEEWRQRASVHRLDLRDPAAAPVAVADSTRWDSHPAVSPDQTRMAFRSHRTGTAQIWVADMEGAQASARTAFRGASVGTPRWSPDGGSLVFEAQREGNRDVWMLKDDGSAPVRVTGDPADDMAPVWSPDGESIYFISDRGGERRIWRMAADGRAPAPVARHQATSLRIAPDGQSLYFTRRAEPGLWTIPVTGGEARRILSGPDLLHRDSYTVTEDQVIFVHHPEDGRTAIATCSLASGEIRPIAPVERMALHSGLDVTRDGRFLYFTLVDQLDIDIVLLNMEKRSPVTQLGAGIESRIAAPALPWLMFHGDL